MCTAYSFTRSQLSSSLYITDGMKQKLDNFLPSHWRLYVQCTAMLLLLPKTIAASIHFDSANQPLNNRCIDAEGQMIFNWIFAFALRCLSAPSIELKLNKPNGGNKNRINEISLRTLFRAPFGPLAVCDSLPGYTIAGVHFRWQRMLCLHSIPQFISKSKSIEFTSTQKKMEKKKPRFFVPISL